MRSGKKVLSAALLLGVVAVALSVAPARADVVTDWNMITGALVANDVGNNPRLRTLAMVHVAMSDAINTVQNRYTRVVATVPLAPDASAEAAAATAARQILSQIYPQQKAKIEETYAASLAAIPDGPAKTGGIKLGMEVAARSKPIAQTTAPMLPILTVRTPPPAHTCRGRRRYGTNMRARSHGSSSAPTSSGRDPRQHCRARSGRGTTTRSRASAARTVRRVLLSKLTR